MSSATSSRHAFAADVSRTLTERGFVRSKPIPNSNYRGPHRTDGFVVLTRDQAAYVVVGYIGRGRSQLAAIATALTAAGYTCSPQTSNGDLRVTPQEADR